MEKIATNEDRLLVETQKIFEYLDKNIYDKIPQNIKDAINNYKGIYKFEYDTTKELNEQDISQSTKDLIVGLYYRYAADEKGKKIVLENIKKRENEIYDRYSVENLFAEKYGDNLNNKTESQTLTVKKESIFKRIINKLLNFFGMDRRV